MAIRQSLKAQAHRRVSVCMITRNPVSSKRIAEVPFSKIYTVPTSIQLLTEAAAAYNLNRRSRFLAPSSQSYNRDIGAVLQLNTLPAYTNPSNTAPPKQTTSPPPISFLMFLIQESLLTPQENRIPMPLMPVSWPIGCLTTNPVLIQNIR